MSNSDPICVYTGSLTTWRVRCAPECRPLFLAASIPNPLLRSRNAVILNHDVQMIECHYASGSRQVSKLPGRCPAFDLELSQLRSIHRPDCSLLLFFVLLP